LEARPRRHRLIRWRWREASPLSLHRSHADAARRGRPVCEHPFALTSQGTASGRFQRAVATRNLFAAEIAAKELGGLSLIHALDFLELLAEVKPERLERAALRWHGRLELEAPTLTMGEAQLALAALAQLP
jgi:hypothetical protein